MNGSEGLTDNKEESQWRKVVRWFLAGLAIILALILAWAGIRYLSVNANSFPEWTGFPEYYPPIDGVQRQQTLIDWLDLLLVPLVLAIAGFLFSRQQKKNEEERARQERETDREIARDRQRQNTLDNYLDKMTELILEKKLGPLAEPDVKRLARTRSLVVLRDLDANRNQQIIQFLQESNLLEFTRKNDEAKGDLSGGIDLDKADLSKADLRWTNLSKISLNKTNLDQANLSNADLTYTNLKEAILFRASLTNTFLNEANLSGAFLNEANLTRAFLLKAILIHTYLTGANLQSANLSEANLSMALLNEANLREASLFDAVLKGTDLSGAALSGADLSGADLSGADLSGADLTKAKYDKNTIWPTGFDPVAAKAEKVSEEG